VVARHLHHHLPPHFELREQVCLLLLLIKAKENSNNCQKYIYIICHKSSKYNSRFQVTRRSWCICNVVVFTVNSTIVVYLQQDRINQNPVR
jgi:hypothetical protein